MEPALSDRFLGKRTLTQAASLLAANWAREDPAAAGKWVNSLPEGEERLWAAKNHGFIWNESDPSAANRWIEALPEQDRQQINEYLKSGEDASQ